MENQKSWVVMETTSKGDEEARNGGLKKRLEREANIPPEDIYIPVLNSGTSKPIILIEGYIFVRSGHPSSSYFDVARTIYINKMIAQFDLNSQLISQSTISDKELKSMVSAAYKKGGRYSVGSRVRVCLGEFRGCEGTIVDIVSEQHEQGLVRDFYLVCVEMRSAEVIIKMDSFSVGDVEHG